MLVPSPRGTEPPHTCSACAAGCGCTGADPGCGHYGCYGARPTRDCPGVEAEEARYAAALAARRAADARTLNRRARMTALIDSAYTSALSAGKLSR